MVVGAIVGVMFFRAVVESIVGSMVVGAIVGVLFVRAVVEAIVGSMVVVVAIHISRRKREADGEV
jgi:phosphate/sulfate permease